MNVAGYSVLCDSYKFRLSDVFPKLDWNDIRYDSTEADIAFRGDDDFYEICWETISDESAEARTTNIFKWNRSMCD